MCIRDRLHSERTLHAKVRCRTVLQYVRLAWHDMLAQVFAIARASTAQTSQPDLREVPQCLSCRLCTDAWLPLLGVDSRCMCAFRD
eukprot:3564126-Amphidinium_carterae.1